MLENEHMKIDPGRHNNYQTISGKSLSNFQITLKEPNNEFNDDSFLFFLCNN